MSNSIVVCHIHILYILFFDSFQSSDDSETGLGESISDHPLFIFSVQNVLCEKSGRSEAEIVENQPKWMMMKKDFREGEVIC